MLDCKKNIIGIDNNIIVIFLWIFLFSLNLANASPAIEHQLKERMNDR
jgi:hypothetical protein